jgi:DNA-binding transcriptional regulator YhcF (GntR family)
MKDKRYINVLTPLDSCPLKLSEVLVYSYQVYQDVFGSIPTGRQIARATGLRATTVALVIKRLESFGLISEHKVQAPPDTWFRSRKNDEPKHWRDGFAYWRYLVRKPACGLSPLESALYSFLAHANGNFGGKRWRPRQGWSEAYLSRVLRCNRETIRTALYKLEEEKLLIWAANPNGINVTLSKVTDRTRSFFEDRQDTTEPEHDVFDELHLADEPEPRDDDSECVECVSDHEIIRESIQSFGITGKKAATIYAAWSDNPEFYADCFNKAQEQEDYTAAFLNMTNQ